MGEHTQLNGAVIGSTASADKNRLDTGTLGFSDIHNQADYKVEHQSIGLSTGGSIGSQFAGNLANTMLAGVNDEGHDSGTTRAAVSDGTLVIRDQDKQAQDVAQLSRDVEHANGSISQIFDKEKEQQRIQQAQLVGEMVSQATDIVRSEMAIHATEAAKAKLATASKDDLDKARQDILDKNPKANPDAEAIASQAYQNYYDAEVKASGFGVGGTYSRVMDTAGAVIKGLAGSDLGAALAGGAAPWIAEYIGHGNLHLSDEEKIAAHAVVNAALAAAQGQNAAAGAAGAVTGELTGMIAAEMYGKKAGALTESEEENTSRGDRALAFFGEPENYWGTVAGASSLFSSAATLTENVISAGLSYGANGAVQIATGNTGDKFDYLSFGLSGLTGAGTAGKSYYSNQLIGAGSAYMTSQIEGQDSTSAVLGSMAGTGFGYNIGASITNKLESQYIKNQLGMDASKNALKYYESSFGPGYLLKGGEMSPLPGTLGGLGGSLISESTSSVTQNETNGGDK